MASPRPNESPGRRRRAVVALLVGAVSVSACATGQRPTFDADQPALAPTGDPAADAVLDRLDGIDLQQFTADYSVLTRLGGQESTATVVQADNSRRSVTINDIRYLNGTGTAATCNLTTGECEASINDARTSDLQLAHDFYGVSMARRLRVDAGRRLDNARGYVDTIAGQQATCADVPVSGGTKTYCVLDSGVLARYDGADLKIELTNISNIADETKFETN
jgi:hypothetical protein